MMASGRRVKIVLAQGNVDVIVGGQFGSEAKGQVAGILAHNKQYDIVISNSGSQAGHTFVGADGTKIVTRHVPIVGVLQKQSTILLGPSCIIDFEVLFGEIERFHLWDRIFIHPNAAIIKPEHFDTEVALTNHMGSTGKGNGAALVDKLMRQDSSTLGSVDFDLGGLTISGNRYNEFVNWQPVPQPRKILIEGAQGFDLSVDRQFWPYCTSRNCWVGQALADAWVHPRQLGSSIMVVRTYPIRVAGPSGGCYADQEETSWEDLGVEPEITTVTKKVRRVFTFSYRQLASAVAVNRPNVLAISHLDYLPEDKRDEFISYVCRTAAAVLGYVPGLMLGYGPKSTDWKTKGDELW